MNPPLDRSPSAPQRGQARSSRARVESAGAARRPLTPDPRDRAARTAHADASRQRTGQQRAVSSRDRGSIDVRERPASARRVDPRVDPRVDRRDDRYDRYDDRYERGPDAGRHHVPLLHLGPSHHDDRRGPAHHRTDRRPLFVVGVAATVLCGFIALRGGDDGADAVAPAADLTATSVAAAPADAAAAVAIDPATGAGATPAVAAATDPAAATLEAAAASGVQDLDGDDLTAADACLMDKLSVRLGDAGTSVSCLQQALTDQGFYTGPVSGTFDQATFTAVEAMQTDRDLYVDGIVGRESAISLGIWPDEESFITRTPPPPPGAVDLLGYPLSSVATAGADAPPLPEDSGSGRRLVYDRAGQRVWAVGENGEIIRSWLVSGSKYSNELPGTHEVYSRSEVSTAWNGKAYLPKMVRWLKTQKGAIGFHSIPLHVEDESPYQTDAELGTRLSGGCQRQAVEDADFVWEWADIGTKVVVV